MDPENHELDYDLNSVLFCSSLQKKGNLIHTHNSSWVIVTEFKGKSFDIYWAVSKLFCLSHLKSIFIPHSDPIIETIENSVSLFRNPLSLLCEIIGFRHYFRDPYSFQNGSNIPFLFLSVISFYINRIRTIDSLVIYFWLKRFYQFRKVLLFCKLIRIWPFRYRYILRIYLQSWSNLLIFTNPRFFPLINYSINPFFSSSIMYYLLTIQHKLGS